MNHLDLFSGIGGFALAVDTVWPGSEHVFCEIDPFCQNVLKKHWPNAQIYGDIRAITDLPSGWKRTSKSKRSRGGEPKTTAGGRSGNVDLLTGGFPCQPFSQAGKRKGTEDDRHLWPEMLRVIQLTKPTWIIAENVRGLLTLQGGVVFEQVCIDLENEGYEVQPIIVPAVAVNAPHRRDRIWFIAHAIDGRQGREKRESAATSNRVQEKHWAQNSATRKPIGADCDGETPQPSTDTTGKQNRGIQQPNPLRHFRATSWERDWREVAFATCDVRVDDGLPKRLARLPDGTTISEAKWRQQALKGYGNAIVPQVAIEIMKAIKYAQT